MNFAKSESSKIKKAELAPILYEERLAEIVMLSWRILKTRFIHGRHRILTEAPFQHYFGRILQDIGEAYCLTREDHFVVDLEECVHDIREKKNYAMGFSFIITDSTAYVNPSRIGVGTFFKMHDGATIQPSSFSYPECKGREDVVVSLRNSYNFSWEKEGNWYFMSIPIKKPERKAPAS